jgi:hypothetical protein
MRIEADYFDGFTYRLLRWELEINDGKAFLQAKWFQPGAVPSLKARFRFDEEGFRVALQSIAGMAEEYQAPVEDQERRRLIVKDGENSIRHHIYGADFLFGEHPEIRTFLSVWRLLDDAVSAHLPTDLLR